MNVFRFILSPLVKNAVFAGTVFGASEFTQQTLRGDDKYDYGYIGRVALTGLLFYGPFCHYFYRALDNAWKGTTTRMIIKKLVLDQTIAGPVSIGGFYIVLDVLEGKKDIFAEAKVKTLPSWGACLLFWPPVQVT
uniref:Mpv17-like protein-like n=1 Tax=Saccoglossus kowalevskii TaxID=10224 RepID=A0ABM0M3Q8_SACKO|nr:PREDICTED: mpv17-like protein-like [Saccoglossus kowalevskii]